MTTATGSSSDSPIPPAQAAAPLASVLVVTFFGSVSGGAFWAGIFFVTALHYGFSPARNLVLGAAMGAVYALTAWFTSALLRRLARRLSPRAILAAALATWGGGAALPLAWPASQPLFWVVALVGAACSAVIWPVVESFLSAGRHGRAMRAAIGWFNVTWTAATAVPLLGLPLFARAGVLYTVAISALVNAVALAALLWLPRRPGAHARDAADAAVGPAYPALARAAAWLLPLSYLMASTMAPILPHRLQALGVGADSAIPALWMVARFAGLALMGGVHFWHGRWSTLLAAGVCLSGGLALVFLAPRLGLVVAGLALFGLGTALAYCAALYYALAVGHAAVDASGRFEALIGLGYFLGPLLGLAARVAGPPALARPLTVALTFFAAAFFIARAIGAYRSARSARGGSTVGPPPPAAASG